MTADGGGCAGGKGVWVEWRWTGGQRGGDGNRRTITRTTIRDREAHTLCATPRLGAAPSRALLGASIARCLRLACPHALLLPLDAPVVWEEPSSSKDTPASSNMSRNEPATRWRLRAPPGATTLVLSWSALIGFRKVARRRIPYFVKAEVRF